MKDWFLYIITVCILLLTLGVMQYLESSSEYYQAMVEKVKSENKSEVK